MIRKFFALFQESEESFEGQEPGEKVVLILRQHPFTVLLPLSFLLFLAIMPVATWLALAPQIEAAKLMDLFFFISSLWYLLLWLISFFLLTFFCLNTVIITDRRIIENEQHHFFNRKVSELHTYRVQDVSVHVDGIIETILHFGELAVQTAGAEREFTFTKIPHPELVKDAIMKTVTAHRSKMKLD